jgi:hypothetical protein
MTVKIKDIGCNYVILKFEKHDEMKETLLSLIAKAEYKSPHIDVAEVDITKTDWFNSANPDREWFKYLVEPLSKHISKMSEELGYGGFTLNEIWFQQYLESSKHGWHTHSGNYTNVYYLELPEGTPRTVIVEPSTKRHIELEIEEGDLVCFPAFVLHEAPENKSDKRKTIISFNTNLTYPDEFYGKGI